MKLKKLVKVMALSLALTMAVPVSVPMSQTAIAEAASVKLSAKKKTLTVGKSYTLKISGTKKKASWSSSKKSVATVSSKGKVTAKKAGTATITAKVGGKKYTCKVTVKNPVNKYVAKAPFKAKEAKFGKATAAIPKNWKIEKTKVNGIDVDVLMPEDIDITKGSANIAVSVVENAGSTQENFELLKAYLETAMTKENMETMLKNNLGDTAKLSDFAFEEVKINLGKATKLSYTITVELNGEKKVMKQIIYDVFAEGYTTEITITDNEAPTTPDVYEVGKYIMNSLIFTK